MTDRACPVVLAAPSGTGKTTLGRRLVRGSDRYAFSVSATTRRPRGTERDGIDYHFLDREAFLAMVARNEFAEWAEVHGRLYGTPKAELDQASRTGTHAVLDIDVQGARQVKEAVPGTKLIFVLPPSLEALLERLRGRGTEEAEDIGRRLGSAVEELGAAEWFDYIVVNDDLDRCLTEVEEIVAGRRVPEETSGSLEAARRLKGQVARLLDEEFEGRGAG